MDFESILKSKNFTYTLYCIIAVLVCTAAFFALQGSDFFATVSRPLDPARVRIIPLVADSIGVDTSSGFKIICQEKYNESQVKAVLTVDPNQPFRLKRTSKKEFLISFEQPLKPNRIYKFGLAARDTGQKRTWAFQTKKSFRVVRTLPRDKANCVPVNSGIEITFSHENYRDVDKYFEISPSVEGRFERHKKTVVFVPKGLMEGTVYTVKLKKGVSLEGSQDQLENDYVFQFQTDRKQVDHQNLSFDKLNNVLPGTAPVIRVCSNLMDRDSEIDVELYKYNSENRFITEMKKYDTFPDWAYWCDDKIKFDTTGLEMVGSFKTKPVSGQYEEYLCFPSPLPEGYYMVNCAAGDIKAQTHIQVNSLVSSITICKDKTLVWVNSAATGQPVEGCTVAPENLRPVKSGSDGIAVVPGEIPLTGGQKNYYFKITSGTDPSLVAVVSRPSDYYYGYEYGDIWYDNNSFKADNVYWNYLFFDRGLYLPSDTVKVWGVVKPRAKTKQPRKMTLELCQTSWSYDENEATIEAKEIKMTPFGTFTGEFQLPNLTAGYYKIAVRTDGNLITERYFEVRQYTKPAYKIDVTAGKKAYFQWEPVKMNIQTSFFEGTPVAGMELAYQYNRNNRDWVNGELACDRNGSAALQISPRYLDSSWHPVDLRFYIHNARAEEEGVSAGQTVTVFPRDLMVEVEGKKTGAKGVVEVKTNRIDLAALNSKTGEYFSEGDYRGKPADVSLKAEVSEDYWDRSETGEYYDFINKKTMKKYKYFEVRKPVQELSFATSGGKFRFEFPFNRDKHYHITVTGFDTRGNKIIETREIYDFEYSPDEDAERYHLEIEDKDASYKIGEKVSLSVKHNNRELIPNPKGRILYLVMQNGLINYTVSSSPRYSFSFLEGYIPNVYVKSVYFDGSGLAKAGMREIRYDHSEKDLRIDLKTDKKQYKPGDTVNVDINVTDAKGSPEKAWLNLSVVDEAFFALREQTVNTRGELYSPGISSGLLADYISHERSLKRGGGAEKGGEGGDESIRSTFKDTAFFRAIETGADGKARTSFKLPDNLTSWRITYQGVAGGIKAGSGKTNISTKLPFFVDTVFNNVFMAGDTPYLTARTFGTEVDNTADIEYRAVLADQNGVKKSCNIRGKGNRFTNIGLGELPEGKYSITVKASCGNYRDAVKREFRVVKNLLESARVKYKKLVDGYKPEEGTSLTTLHFYNPESAAYYEALESMRYTWGVRVDQKLARKRAVELMKKYYGEELYWDEDFDGQMYQQGDGGIALLTYDSSDPELSAKICSAAGENFDKNALKDYFYSILDNSKSEPEAVAASCWGLAAMSEPVLLETRNLLRSPGIDLKQKIYLGLALAELGDDDGAREVYNRMIAENSKRTAPYVYIQYGKDRDDVLDATSLCAVLSLKTGAEEKYSLFNYVRDSSPKDILINLERLMFVSISLPEARQTGQFSYEIDGVKKDIALKGIERYKLALTREKAAGIKFSNIRGDIGVAEVYYGPLQDLMQNPDKLVKLARTYSVDDVNKNRFKQSDLVKITLEPVFEANAPDGYYEITDVLPCGLRVVSRWPDSREWYWYENSGQKIVFGLFHGKNKPKKIVYYARAVSEGTFTADNAMIKHEHSDVSGFTDRAKVIIGDGLYETD